MASWMEEHNVAYIYQAPFGVFAQDIFVDFLILGTAPRLVLECLGDHFHEGNEQIAIDRQRILLVEAQGAIVVQVWSHDIFHETGFAYPTWESFNRIMEAAINGIELSTAL